MSTSRPLTECVKEQTQMILDLKAILAELGPLKRPLTIVAR